MKKLMVAMAVLCLFLVGCGGKTAVGTAKTDNRDISLEKLFTDSNGYTVMRFVDNGYYHYYVVPGPAKMSTTVPQGKTTRQEIIETK